MIAIEVAVVDNRVMVSRAMAAKVVVERRWQRWERANNGRVGGGIDNIGQEVATAVEAARQKWG